MAEGLDDFDMTELGEKEYERTYEFLNDEGRNEEYERLRLLPSDEDTQARMNYIDTLRGDKDVDETSFIGGDNIETSLDSRFEGEAMKNIVELIQEKYNIRPDKNNDNWIELQSRTGRTGISKKGWVTFKPKGDRGFNKEQTVVKRNTNGDLVFNDAKVSEKAVEQFKRLIGKVVEDTLDTGENIERFTNGG